MILEKRLFGRAIWLNPLNGDFSFNKDELYAMEDCEVMPSPGYSRSLYKCLTFCLEISNSCNLDCSYCFSKKKDGKIMGVAEAEAYLDALFSFFPNAEKYFVDLSGNGEPLMNLGLIKEISLYAKRKSDQIDREVTVCLVTNGTLLSRQMVAFLERNSVLYGVSLDGSCEKEDKNRVYRNGNPSFSDVFRNVSAIKNREYVGAAVTITKEVFPLVESLDRLSLLFKTISVKPVRSMEIGLDEKSLAGWNAEYDKLTRRIIDDISKNDDGLLFRLLNGDDFFGKFIVRAYLHMKCLCRCDAGLGRFAVSMDGSIYPCPALGSSKGQAIGTAGGLIENRIMENYSSILRRKNCGLCEFRWSCGGECLAESEMRGGVKNETMCAFKKHLALLGIFIVETSRLEYPAQYETILAFCKSKRDRQGENKRLRAFLSGHRELTFTEGKKRFDSEFPSY